jgi:3-oxoacyl-[acyl-carrier-protein] synthase-3
MKSLFNNTIISSIASAVPQNQFDLSTLQEEFGLLEVKKIIANTGITSVRKAPIGLTASDMCEAAFLSLVKSSELDTSQIDAVVFVSQTADYKLPQTSGILQDKLGLSKETACFDLPMGCAGYPYGLFLSSMLVNSGAKKVLLLAGETTTHIINEKDRSLSMLFGDAGTASIIEKGNSYMSVLIRGDGSGKDKLIVPAGGSRLPISNVTSKIVEVEKGIFRSQNDLYMDGLAVMNFALSEVPRLIDDSLNLMSWQCNEVDSFLFHQANGFMLNYLRRKLRLSQEQVPICIDGYGNTGPASIPLLLSDMGQSLKSKNKLKKALICGFGVGLSLGSVCTDLSNTKFYKPILI